MSPRSPDGGGGGGGGFASGSRRARGTGTVDVAACLRMGLTGGLGAIPGTLAAYPLDILKIRMQTTDRGGYRSAVQFVLSSGQHGSAACGLSSFYRGVIPAVELRVIARGSMFLFSELCTQVVEHQTPLSGMSSRFVGSIGSGYTTGLLAGLAEYRKKLLSQNIVRGPQARYVALLRAAGASGHGGSLLRRLHAAGCRSAINDSCFFTAQHYLAREKGWSTPASYASAAACGVIGAFLLDTAVARMMLVPPWQPVPSLAVSARAVVRDRGWSPHEGRLGGLAGAARGLRGGYRGILARAAEFSISYGCTGLVGTWLACLSLSWPTATRSGPLSRETPVAAFLQEEFEQYCSEGAAVASAVLGAGLFAHDQAVFGRRLGV